MALYLCKFKYTPETWAKLRANPEDRRMNAARGFEGPGGKMLGFWYAMGEYDGYSLFDSPSQVAAAASLVRFFDSGALAALETVPLIEVDDMLEALVVADGIAWTAPGENPVDR